MDKKNRDACVRYESYKLMEDKKSMHYFEENLAARKREKDEKLAYKYDGNFYI